MGNDFRHYEHIDLEGNRSLFYLFEMLKEQKTQSIKKRARNTTVLRPHIE